jgi:hypothetical protein
VAVDGVMEGHSTLVSQRYCHPIRFPARRPTMMGIGASIRPAAIITELSKSPCWMGLCERSQIALIAEHLLPSRQTQRNELEKNSKAPMAFGVHWEQSPREKQFPNSTRLHENLRLHQLPCKFAKRSALFILPRLGRRWRLLQQSQYS